MIFAILGFSVKLILDYVLFGYLHFSTLRFLLINFNLFLGLYPGAKMYTVRLLYILKGLLIFSPLQFLLYKLYKKGLKEELVFISVSTLFFLFIYTNQVLYYLFPLSGIVIYHLAKQFTRKQVKIAIVISIPLIAILSIPAFTGSEQLYFQDVKDIHKDFQRDAFIVDKDLDSIISAATWDNKPYFIWLDEYIARKKGDDTLRKVKFKESPKASYHKLLEMSVSYHANMKQYYPEKLPFIGLKNKKCSLEGYQPTKCYQYLCVYEKKP